MENSTPNLNNNLSYTKAAQKNKKMRKSVTRIIKRIEIRNIKSKSMTNKRNTAKRGRMMKRKPRRVWKRMKNRNTTTLIRISHRNLDKIKGLANQKMIVTKRIIISTIRTKIRTNTKRKITIKTCMARI